MDSNRKMLNLSDPEDKIRIVGLKNLNLLQKESVNYKYTYPKKSVLKKSLNRRNLLFNINSPKSSFHSKIRFTPSTPNITNSNSQSRKSKITSKSNSYIQKYKQKLYNKNLLLIRNINIYSPKIQGFKSIFSHENGKRMKNSFSTNYKATNASSNFNMNLLMDKTTPSNKSYKVSLNNILQQNKKLSNKTSDTNNYEYLKDEKNIFGKKLKRKKENEESKENILYKNRKKYPFIKASDFFKIKKSIIPESINKINKKLCSILLKENIIMFQDPITIIGKGKFSKKYENIKDTGLIENKEEYPIINDIHVGDYILKYKETKKEEDEKTKTKDKRIIINKFIKKMMEIYLIKKNLKIPISEIIKKYKTPKHIFNFEQTNHLNHFIKIKDLKKALLILSNCHYLVTDFDQFYLTPLHYAAKYNFFEIIPHLMSYGAYVDAKTSFGMTPLMLCLKKNYYESMVFLFLYMANPFFKINMNNYINDTDINDKTKNILNRIKLIYFKNRIYRDKNFYLSVKSDIYDFVINECRDLFESDFLDLVKTNYKL